MSAFFSRFSPIPAYPTYTGPYEVGTLEVEIPVEELPSPAPAPEPTIPTISFRIFYPCETPTKPAKPVYWLPDPQRAYFGAYIRFLGASRRLSGVLQYVIPRHTIMTLSGRTLLTEIAVLDICPSLA